MHYPRIPGEYWAHRLRMFRAMGLNTVSTYVFWNLHEPAPGKFQFDQNADVAAFCRLAQQEGLKIIIRPGPYVCAEWDMGGLPWWLLQDTDKKVHLRTRNPVYLEAVRCYFSAVGEQLAPLQVTRGGPIILVQVENEYLGFGHDAKYIDTLRDYLRQAGFDVHVQHPRHGPWTCRLLVAVPLRQSTSSPRRGASIHDICEHLRITADKCGDALAFSPCARSDQ